MSATPTDVDESVPASRRLDVLATRWYVALTFGLAAVVGLASVLMQRRYSQFFADDFLYLQLARDGEVTPHWLVIDNYGHFAPLTRLAYFVVQRTVGLDYALAALLPAAVVATIFLSLVWLFTELLGRRPLALVLALIGVTSVPLVRTMLWWGAAMHVLGAAALMTLCVAAFIAHGRRGHVAFKAVSVAALVAALLVQERPMLTIGYLVLIRYLFKLGLPAYARVSELVRREAVFWLPWVVVEVAYVVYRFFIFPSAPAPGDAGGTLDLIYESVFRGYAPAVVGSRNMPFSPLVTTPTLLGLVTLAVLVGILVVLRRSAWRTVFFLVAVYAVNLGIVAAGRLDVASVSLIVLDLQYYVDVHIATLVAFTLGFAELPARRPASASASASASGGGVRRAYRRGRPIYLRWALAAGVVALAVSTGVTLHAIAEGNNQTVAHAYVNRVQGELERTAAPFDLLRTKLPVDVAPSFIDPWTDVSGVFALDDDIAERMDPTADERLVVTETGRVVTAHPTTLRTIPLTPETATARVGTFSDDQEQACLTGPADSNVRVRLEEPVNTHNLFFALTYTSQDARKTRAVLIGNRAKFNQNLTELPAGESVTVVDRLDGHAATQVVLSFDRPVRDLCLQQLWIGRISADVATGCRVLTHHGEPTRESDDCAEEWPVF